MEKFVSEGSNFSPTINFNFGAGKFEITGRCVPENSREFFKPIFEALSHYEKVIKPATDVHIELEYFNTSSSKEILDVFRVFAEIEKKGSVVTIFWRYDEEDEEMRETGLEYQAITELKFEMVPIIV